MSSLEFLLVMCAAGAAFTTSAAACLGGSLILVPALALVLGTKEGVALAALLFALDNVVKVVAYRRTIPLAESATVIALTIARCRVSIRGASNLPPGSSYCLCLDPIAACSSAGPLAALPDLVHRGNAPARGGNLGDLRQRDPLNLGEVDRRISLRSFDA